MWLTKTPRTKQINIPGKTIKILIKGKCVDGKWLRYSWRTMFALKGSVKVKHGKPELEFLHFSRKVHYKSVLGKILKKSK